MQIIGTLLSVVAAGIALPICMLAVECIAALVPRRRNSLSTPVAPTAVDVLIPAHDEALVLETTLSSLHSQLADGDRVWVIADNSTDATAEIARRAGVGVFERRDPERRGKGYALDYALRRLADDHRDVVVILDADCQLARDSLRKIAALARSTGRPVQARYIMTAPAAGRPADVLSQLAVIVKNVVRPMGLARLHLPCLLTGSGMAFPWPVIRDAHLATGSIVEDTQLSIDLLLRGHNPVYCAEAEVSAVLPAQRQAILSQRTRWEHGHLQLILTQTPRLMWGALTQRRPALLAAALDVAVPPLSLLAIVWGLSAGAALAFGQLAGYWLAAGISAASGGLLFMTILCVNRAFSGHGSWKTLAAVPAYIALKAPIYARFLWRRQSAWVRTAREGNP